MALVIQTHTTSLEAQRNLNPAAKTDGKTVDPASGHPLPARTIANDSGLAISDALRIEIRSCAAAERSANDGISMMQTADGALAEMSDLLGRMRELASPDTKGVLTGDKKVEFSRLQAEVGRIQKAATYEGRALLGSAEQVVGFNVGANDASGFLEVTLGGFDLGAVLTTNTRTSGAGGRTFLPARGQIDDALAAITSQRARFGAAVNRFTESTSTVQTARTNLVAASTPLENSNAAEELAKLCQTQLLGNVPGGVLSQANQLPQHAIGLLSG